ncbi:DUF4279 domain-containing protein [Actinacidiphila bryophytorum]|uniref:DUF4279 domain-containing protein n=1 Tax=Actinacidiphila bryophytorum TaxID=1436133 RepID=UPI002176EBB6|nr:DUF4279 domain-containing protein [Actinacidiphila bryophytorum]UWE07694.1 DUF4279 domain-containing protein [Actinacidiphila bryophytorum]
MPEDVTMQPRTADIKWSKGSIRIMSQAVSAREISARLGLAADAEFEQGSLMSPRNPASARRESSVWVLRSGLPDDRDLAEHVRALVGLVDGCREALAGLSDTCDLELSLGFGSENGQGGCVLPAGLLADVAGLGLDLVLDLYPPETAEPVS